MSQEVQNSNDVSRRKFLGGTTAAGAASAFQILKPQAVRAQSGEKLRIGLIGCGGRGTRGVNEAITGNPQYSLVAMADLFEDQMERSLRRLRDSDEFKPEVRKQIQVEPTKRYLGFDAYKKLIDDSDVDVVFLHTPPGWRPEHFEYAVKAGKHIFSEKPVATDPVGCRRFMDAARESERKKLSVGMGAQRRSQKKYLEVVDKIHNGEFGEVLSLYANWMSRPVIKGKEFIDKADGLAWQHRAWYSHVWICGDQVVEQHLHNIDVCNWIMNDHPVSVIASGGAAWRPKNSKLYGNIYDHCHSNFVYRNGVRMTSACRQFPHDDAPRVVDERMVGSKGSYHFVNMRTDGLNPYVTEHTEMMKSINGDGPYINRALAVAESTMTAIMAREAAYSGVEVTWDMIMASKRSIVPTNPTLDGEFDVPPLPVPGEYKFI